MDCSIFSDVFPVPLTTGENRIAAFGVLPRKRSGMEILWTNLTMPYSFYIYGYPI